MTTRLTSLKVVLSQHRPFGNTDPSLDDGLRILRDFVVPLHPAHVTERYEASIPLLMTLGLGLPPFERPKDAMRPVVAGIVGHTKEYLNAQSEVERRLRSMPPNTFLLLYCLEDTPLELEVPEHQCRIVRTQDIRGRSGSTLRGAIKQWRIGLNASEVT